MFNKKRKKRQLIEEDDFVPKAFQNNKKSDNENIKKKINKSNHKNPRVIKKETIDKGNRSIKRRVKRIILIIILISILIIGISLGISAHRWKTLAKEMIVNENSVVLDIDGNEIAKIGCERKNEKIELSNISKDLKNAYISIEDERFYSHGGIDIKRTGGAIVSYIVHFGESSYGGSTITQQLVKNLTGDSTDSIIRKVKEWWKACVLETVLSKDEILEAYLNIIYVGPNMYGVETGAKYYFNKSVSELSLEECAFLAGINNSPNSYNPFGDKDNTDKINKRTKTVLAKMLELKYIDNDEYEKAINNINSGLKFKKGSISSEDAVYSYHTDALILEVIQDISKKYNISNTFATNYLNMAGLTINSTQDSKVQKQMNVEFEKNKYKLTSKNGGNSSQAAMVIIDHSTGKVVGCTGGLGKKTEARSLNRATQSIRQTGSAIKPIAVLAPAIDKKIITAASIYDDTEKDFADGYHPTDYSKALGKITVRRAVESSQNIPFVEIMEQLKPQVSIKYLEKMGITTLAKEDNSLVLSLGGLQKGISPLEMAGAYATIANDGEYIEPTFYSNIKNKVGKEILKPKQNRRRVFSKEVAYILKNILTQPVNGTYGTATYCKISGVDVAAKTGTTDENYDRWLCGFTPYYTAVTWYGYDQNETIEYNKRNPAGLLWANVMSRIHEGLNSATFIKLNTVTSVTICADSGKKARTGCKNIYTEYFLWLTTPDLCNEHNGTELDDDGKNSSNNKVQNDVQEIIQGITNEIDAEDPQQKYIEENKETTNSNAYNTTTNNNTNITSNTNSNYTNTNNDSNISNTSNSSNSQIVNNTSVNKPGTNTSTSSNETNSTTTID